MKKIAILITSMMLFASVVCIVPATESDGAIMTEDNILPYEVYKVDISTKYSPNVSSNDGGVKMVYFLSNDKDDQDGFENALRTGAALPSSVTVAWNGNTSYDLTVYVLGVIARPYSYGDGTTLYIYWYNGDHNTQVYLSEKHRMKEFSSSVYLLSGQTVKITVTNVPDSVSLGFASGTSSLSYYGHERIYEGENEIKITARGLYGVYNIGSFSQESISYTIEYEDTPTDTSTYGYVFLALGVLFLAILILFGLPQKIKD